MYELFILGQLMDHPMTGYQLRKALVNVVGSELTISFGALYPLLDKLAAAEELTLAFKRTTNKRPQKLATITAAGRTQFWQLVMTPVALNKQTQLTFQIKLNFLHLLSRDQQQVILLDFQQFARGQVARLTAQHKRVMTNTYMLAADIQDALMVNELQRVRAQAQLDWLDRQLRNGGEVKG
ncbi:PadR family transcriptional regulator [Lactiplantibacillus plantarum]|uniref:PadR family transcriptional regulator n=1 Tax=Lactiplantibacillus plantarum TaxID=1590 RepID=UPI0007BC5606|nr:helix-turn-helix transcriptional regulator [Lactiplantibacillus plantarum]AUV72791.1 PadR family transcriptional regulator [Lactiplantibacillus plantarum subsp. plantarum]AWY47058.1 PadR family transcriptional regulator [Lactiplantibacillus plantarum]KZU04817.1 Transcriptional regulator PadR family [Lactiplantibacillus plantarum]KZU87173.1 Transcriptional regulator PadR family [Lactiplantibacillus plantarum]MCT3267556.1 PadR family transcriptional regulator [Lactiplantibacillus plantarum]